MFWTLIDWYQDLEHQSILLGTVKKHWTKTERALESIPSHTKASYLGYGCKWSKMRAKITGGTESAGRECISFFLKISKPISLRVGNFRCLAIYYDYLFLKKSLSYMAVVAIRSKNPNGVGARTEITVVWTPPTKWVKWCCSVLYHPGQGTKKGKFYIHIVMILQNVRIIKNLKDSERAWTSYGTCTDSLLFL